MLKLLNERPDWQVALPLTCAMRIFWSAAAAAISFVVRPPESLIRSNAFTQNLPPAGTWHYALVGVWERFDTLWYLHIAQHGYDRPGAVVFYPLYPFLIRALSPIFGGIASALWVSTAASFFLLWGVLQLERMDLPDPAALRGLTILACWPTSFIFFAAYTESLAIALVVWSIVFARRERWAASAACGFAAGLTRSMGALAIVPLAIMAWRSRKVSRWSIILVPAGTLAYWAWLRMTGRPSLPAAYHYWNTGIATPWTTLWRALVYLIHTPDALVAINLGVLILFTVAGVNARRRVEDRFFAAAVIAQILMRACVPPLTGVCRYVLPIYPAFMTFGQWASGMKQSRFALLCVGLFAFNLGWMWAFLKWSLVL